MRQQMGSKSTQYRFWMMKEKNRKKYKFVALLGLIITLCMGLTGCVNTIDQSEKLQDLDFTVLSEERIPEELMTIIQERWENPFKLTYTDQEYLYICVGYGKQDTGGYSIAVDELYETSNAIVAETMLLGPKEKIQGDNIASYPYIVIKLENIEKSVVFDE